MKKYLYILICILVCFISACSPYTNVVKNSENETIADEFEDREIIDSGKYYRIYRTKKDITKVCYNIYNSEGETVLSETTDRPLIIEMLNNDIVDIKIGMGTGITINRYYNVQKNVFSQDFSYVLSDFNELVTYIDVQKENPFENRKVIVQNIFDRDSFYKEFSLNFSKVDTPVIESSFVDDGTALNIIYLSGTEQSEKTTVLPINTKSDTDLNLVKQQLETASGLNVISINYDDYDLDGYYEAFALMGEDAFGRNRKSEYGIETHNAEIWFLGREGAQKLAEQFDCWSDDGIKIINGQAFWCASKYYSTEYISYIYYVKNSIPVEANISEKGGNFKCLYNGDVLLTFSEYDGMESEKMLLGHTYKDYVFFWNSETGKFAEYGGILLTKEEFLNINGASELLMILEEEQISLEEIYYYANDTVAVNYSKGEYRYHLIINLHNDAFLRPFSIDDLYQKGGFLTTAVIPEIAVYPTNIPYYMQSK